MSKETIKARYIYLKSMFFIGLDIFWGILAILTISFLLYLWSAEFFAFEFFWGPSRTPLIQYSHIVKTAATLILFINLFGMSGNGKVSSLIYDTYFAQTILFDESDLLSKDPKPRGIRVYIGMLGGSLFTFIVAFLVLPWVSQFF